jgi:hypothetical protein
MEQQNRLLVNAEAEIVDGERILTCKLCGYRWTPRVSTPKQCPNCKRTISANEHMVDIKRQKVLAALPEINNVKDIVPEYFTPQCSQCPEEATVQIDGLFYCGACAIDRMREKGMVKDG